MGFRPDRAGAARHVALQEYMLGPVSPRDGWGPGSLVMVLAGFACLFRGLAIAIPYWRMLGLLRP